MLKVALSFVAKGLLALAVLGTIVYLSICAFLLLRQNRLIFFPSATIETTPARFNLPYQDVWIPVKSSHKVEKMHGWWMPASGSEKGVVLHLHGNGYNMGANVSQSLRFHQLGFSVFAIDYRGYGQSEGNFPNEASVYQDARAAWNYLTQERKISPERIFVFGHSLGGAIAIDLAAQHPGAAGLIVQSSFTSMRSIVDRLNQFWMFPVDWLLTQRFASVSKVRSLKLPVLYVHGTADETVPATMSEALAANTPEPKQLFLVVGARHNDVPEVGGAEYLHVLNHFMKKAYRYEKAPQ